MWLKDHPSVPGCARPHASVGWDTMDTPQLTSPHRPHQALLQGRVAHHRQAQLVEVKLPGAAGTGLPAPLARRDVSLTSAEQVRHEMSQTLRTAQRGGQIRGWRRNHPIHAKASTRKASPTTEDTRHSIQRCQVQRMIVYESLLWLLCLLLWHLTMRCCDAHTSSAFELFPWCRCSK